MKTLTSKKAPVFIGALALAMLPLGAQANSAAVKEHQDVNSQPLVNTGADGNAQQVDWNTYDLSGYSAGVAEAAQRLMVKENKATGFDTQGKYESASQVGHGKDW